MNQSCLGSMPCMKVSEPVSMPARARAAQASGPWMARKTRSSGVDLCVEILGQRAQMRFVGGGVAGIGDDHEALVAEPGDDQVVDDAGGLVEEEGVFGLRDLERAGIQRAGAVEQRRGAGTADLEQLHVRDVEQAGMLAGVKMLLHHAGRIGERHRPAGKRAKARACGLVQIFEGRCLVSSPVMTSPESHAIGR